MEFFFQVLYSRKHHGQHMEPIIVFTGETLLRMFSTLFSVSNIKNHVTYFFQASFQEKSECWPYISFIFWDSVSHINNHISYMVPSSSQVLKTMHPHFHTQILNLHHNKLITCSQSLPALIPFFKLYFATLLCGGVFAVCIFVYICVFSGPKSYSREKESMKVKLLTVVSCHVCTGHWT